jgi:hypothetical protein
MQWIYLAKYVDYRRHLVSMLMNLQIPRLWDCWLHKKGLQYEVSMNYRRTWSAEMNLYLLENLGSENELF